ncbi:MAG: adenosine deaminase [Chloroflexi bacterium]|nr:adenosine deaminase [Chloroflexota bacterium]MCI0579101.1 adenosine deaminase [Chloroflexota bacterium]MCI0650077.1 adenosine deaminase [Chloroflexota bacterium]MCI0728297.1 adenosine deaminase [Chloroflexota bacterium]
MPKIDLHRHLEGSLRLDTLAEIAREHGMELPADDIESLRPYVQVTNDPPSSKSFLAKFEVLRRFYRSPEAVARITYEAIADAAADNIHYLELRFSPQALARVRGFPLEDVTDWVIEAAQRASQACHIEVGLIITLVRHEKVELARKVAGIAFDRRDRGIVGIDLAGDEVNYPSHPFRSIFRQARELNMGITVHAGEWTGAETARNAMEELYAARLGHGVRAVENFEVLQLVREREVALEICLTSNLQTGVVRSISHHPLLDLLDLGIRVTLNTDDPSVSDSTLTDEYQVAVQALGLGYRELRQMILNAAAAAFLPPDGRERLIQHFAAIVPER